MLNVELLNYFQIFKYLTDKYRPSWGWIYPLIFGNRVKPVDDDKASQYKNADHPGTPESFESFVIGGARGGGGSDYPGSYSGTANVEPRS